MNITEIEKASLDHISKSADGRVLIDFLKRVAMQYADVRNIANPTIESIKGHQIACDIIENEIISRLSRSTTDNKLEITEEFE